MALDLVVMVPDGVAVRTRVVSLRAADASGLFGLRPGHERILTLLAPCILALCEENGRERYVAADGGVLIVENDRVSVVTREATVADRLEEVADTAAVMLETRGMRERTARIEFAELRTALLRELRKMERRT